jgi:hypothetical protein
MTAAADRSPARPRLLVLLGIILMIASGFLPWWAAGGDTVSGVPIPAASGIGLQGPGMVIYLVAVIALVLLDIGYVRGRWGFVLDAPPVYLALGLVAAAALAVRGYELVAVSYFPFPDRSPGFAAAAAGIALLLFGAGAGFGTRPRA